MYEVEILRPASVVDASQMMAAHGYDAKLMAGGSAVTLLLTQRLIAPRYLVALDRLPGARDITFDPGTGLSLGALVTHHQVETSPAVRQQLPILAETFHKVANIRVRHQATVGGVLCEADYASDPPAMLLALQAGVKAVSERGERWIELSEFFTDFYETCLDPDEILTEVQVPALPEDAGAAYIKFNTRSPEDRPCVGVAAVLHRKNGVCESLQVVVGAAAATPQKFPEAEVLAAGSEITEELAREIGFQYAQAIEPISDIRGSDTYRTQVIEVLVRRAILQAAEA